MTTTLATGIAMSLLLPGWAAVAGPTSTAGATAPAPRAESKHDLFLDFDGKTGETPNLESSGTASVSTTITSADGGTVVGVRHKGQGRAARLEPFDPESPTELAALVVRPEGDADPFAPGKAPFAFGAVFRLDAESEGSAVDDGNNLVQRGLYDDDAQFKMQLDDERLSCRVTGSAGSVLVQAADKLSPRRWHRARCVRRGDSVTLRLLERTADGPVRHRWTRSGDIGALTFSSKPPLSVGGKVDAGGEVVADSSDQFNGRVDNVFFRRLDG